MNTKGHLCRCLPQCLTVPTSLNLATRTTVLLNKNLIPTYLTQDLKLLLVYQTVKLSQLDLQRKLESHFLWFTFKILPFTTLLLKPTKPATTTKNSFLLTSCLPYFLLLPAPPEEPAAQVQLLLHLQHLHSHTLPPSLKCSSSGPGSTLALCLSPPLKVTEPCKGLFLSSQHQSISIYTASVTGLPVEPINNSPDIFQSVHYQIHILNTSNFYFLTKPLKIMRNDCLVVEDIARFSNHQN